MENSLRKARIEILLLFALYIFILPRAYMDYDMGFWREWALAIHRHGIANAYSNGINYLPVYLYGLAIFDWLQGTEANIINNINNIKILFVFFDFLPLLVLCGFRQKLLSFKIPYLYLLLNIAYVFNSMVWGQMDSMYTNIAFLAIVTGLFYPVAASLLFLLALNTKQQAIEFVPVIGIVLLYSIKNIKTVVVAILSAIALQMAILLPFIQNGSLNKLYDIITHSVNLYNKLSICAFNLWYLIIPDNPYFIDDRSTFFLISYKATGLILFSISALLVLLPLLRHTWKLKFENQMPNERTYRLLFLSTGLLCLYFFFFNVQMHERYANPIIILFFFYGVASKNYKLYILASIPYFLSLDKCFPDFLPIVHYKLIFASRVIAIWYGLTVIYGSYLFYKEVKMDRIPLRDL